MKIEEFKLNPDEKAVFLLRSLYERYGYSRYKMNKFEEYELYLRNKDFLVSDHVITFTDPGGKMMALKPDVTLSIVKNGSDGTTQKVYYNENVYRVTKGTEMFRELMQVGLECIGDINGERIREVLLLALQSLEAVSDRVVLDISSNAVTEEILDVLGVQGEERQRLLRCMAEKRVDDILRNGGNDALRQLLFAEGSTEEVRPILTTLYGGTLSGTAEEFLRTVSELEEAGYRGRARIDFSVQNDLSYYNGIVFKGFIDGIAHSVLSGGRYDSLMQKMGRRSGAIGFAVYLDFLERWEENVPRSLEKPVLNIALPKGRLGEKVYDLFEKAGYACPAIREPGRKLIFENESLAIRYFWVKPSDVAIYVERGAADIGVCGKDILLEYEPDVYELADLGMGKCRMAVAAKRDFCDDKEKTLRVATKFSNIAQTYYNAKGRDIDIVHLNGSIEIAPVLGLTDVIVDIVETGTTLRENDLQVFAEILPISARLIANKSSYKFKSQRIRAVAQDLAAEAEERK